MKVGEIILVGVCIAIVVGVIITAIMRKKSGKNSCGCDCSACGYCSQCKNKKNKAKKVI